MKHQLHLIFKIKNLSPIFTFKVFWWTIRETKIHYCNDLSLLKGQNHTNWKIMFYFQYFSPRVKHITSEQLLENQCQESFAFIQHSKSRRGELVHIICASNNKYTFFSKIYPKGVSINNVTKARSTLRVFCMGFRVFRFSGHFLLP